MRHYLIAGLITVAGSTAMANETDPLVDLSVRFIPWVDSETSAFGGAGKIEGDGQGFGGRLQAGGALFVYGDYNETNLDAQLGGTGPEFDLDFTETRFGGGFKHSTERGYIAVSGESYRVKLEDDTTKIKDDGYGVHLGGGFNMGTWATLYGKVGFISLDDLDGQEYLGGITGRISENGRIFAEYRNLNLEDGPVEIDHSDARVGVAFAF